MTIETIKEAAKTLAPVIVPTPVTLSHPLSTPTQTIYLKLENLQRTGSFKLRGAFTKVASLSDEERRKGIIASSAGNHAQGVALAGQHFGVPAVIVMPNGTPTAKVLSTRSYGAQIVFGGIDYDAAYKTALTLQEEKGYTFIHPFNDETVISGQGTVAVEILQQVSDIDAIVVPVGGGGLVAGVAIAARHYNPKIRIIGVQASTAASMVDSLREGHIVELPKATTIADGIRVRRPGDKTFSICQDLGVEMVSVSEDDIQHAILFMLEKHRVICEGAGSVPVAAFLAGKLDPTLRRICLLVSGGNIDAHVVSQIIDRGLLLQKRRFHFRTLVEDKPGTLCKLTELLSDLKVNIMQITQTRHKYGLDIEYQVVDVLVQTSGAEHTEQMVKSLKDNKYDVQEL